MLFCPPAFSKTGNTDPFFSSVVALLHGEGGDGTTTFTDQKGHTFTGSGNAQIDTAQFKFGAASMLFDGTGDFISSADHADWELGSGDFTIEFFARFNSTASTATIIAKIDAAATDFMSFGILRQTTNLHFYASSDNASFDIANGVQFATSLSTGTWYHIAINRTSNAWRGYIDGVGTSVSSSSAAIFNSAFQLRIGGPSDAANYNGWIDDLRITKGVGRYPSDFTPPSTTFPDA